jgi:hypothetical protein
MAKNKTHKKKLLANSSLISQNSCNYLENIKSYLLITFLSYCFHLCKNMDQAHTISFSLKYPIDILNGVSVEKVDLISNKDVLSH